MCTPRIQPCACRGVSWQSATDGARSANAAGCVALTFETSWPSITRSMSLAPTIAVACMQRPRPGWQALATGRYWWWGGGGGAEPQVVRLLPPATTRERRPLASHRGQLADGQRPERLVLGAALVRRDKQCTGAAFERCVRSVRSMQARRSSTAGATTPQPAQADHAHASRDMYIP